MFVGLLLKALPIYVNHYNIYTSSFLISGSTLIPDHYEYHLKQYYGEHYNSGGKR